MSDSCSFESYPPRFQLPNSPLYHDHEEDLSIDEVVIDSETLPVIDFGCINEEKEKLHEACAEWGVFRLVNHGIPTSLLNQLHETSKQVFDHSLESKQKLFSGSPITYFRGTPALNSKGMALQEPQNVDCMEGFNVPLSQLPCHTHADEDGDDPLPTSFRYLIQEYGDHQSRLAETIYKAITERQCEALEDCSSYLALPTGVLRVYRYPAVSQINESSWGMDAHTDSSLISILNEDLVGGLQFYRLGHWFHVRPIPNTFIVNLGDMMQAISDDEYKSVKHRVRLNKLKERLSIGYFVFPDDNTLIHSQAYKPFSYSDFRTQVQQDITTVGYKVGLPRFRRSG
ncbi:Gibberellin 2-beta-dioxygenase 8 [Heracleum sosnowskyi]|uniref:Gibberellin 2-beta-dioxygenase 8 n=1 Tax=Heracleum sosnowskyi TaxID=360622 RepID=A0AAD8M0C6_9APIA|nr:Gibberellin 2-beta-dioxygenase 8 [Heracleum sosnowskyi]